MNKKLVKLLTSNKKRIIELQRYLVDQGYSEHMLWVHREIIVNDSFLNKLQCILSEQYFNYVIENLETDVVNVSVLCNCVYNSTIEVPSILLTNDILLNAYLNKKSNLNEIEQTELEIVDDVRAFVNHDLDKIDL